MTNWYAIRVRPVWEGKVAAALTEHKVDHYLPKEVVWRRHRGRKIHHARPLIPGYVFALLSDDDLALIHSIDGTHRVIMFNGKPAAIPFGFIVELRSAEADGLFDKTLPKTKPLRIAAGERVKIKAGPHAARIGIIAKVKNNHRIQVLFDGIGGGLKGDTKSFDDKNIEAADSDAEDELEAA